MSRPLVAVVNDDTQYLRMMEMVLASAGYRTVVFFEGDAAFEEIRRTMPDVVVLDIRMESPESGWTILDLMRLDESTADIPVVVCSADHRQLLAKEEYLATKRASVLRKPFDIDDLISSVSELLEGRSDPAPGSGVASPTGEDA